MKRKDLKYLLAYIPILSAFVAMYYQGIFSYATLIIAFVIVPILEFLSPGHTDNVTPEEEDSLIANRFFDFLLYLNVPLVFLMLWYFGYIVFQGGLATYEYIGLCGSIGVVIGASGINVAHELGHRTEKWEQTLSKILLLPALYMHFFIEHNRGHHLRVSTPEDPATARKGEILFFFWIRSSIGGYLHAWQLEKQRLTRKNKALISLHNEMIRFTIIQFLYVAAVFFFFGPAVGKAIVTVGIIGFLLLETINYVEHYGLQRKKLKSGRYEKVQIHHSWNSNHEAGRILLYELTRHADHHYKATRKYQVLRHYDDSPQLPLGYPGSMFLAMIPPAWFWVMNKRIPASSV